MDVDQFLPKSEGGIKLIEREPARIAGMLKEYQDRLDGIYSRATGGHAVMLAVGPSGQGDAIAICPNCTRMMLDEVKGLAGFLEDCLKKYAEAK